MESFHCSDSILFTTALTILYISSFRNFLSATAPYGKHSGEGGGGGGGGGRTIPAYSALILMESPTIILPLLLYFLLPGPTTLRPLSILSFSLFLLHYVNRTLIYPLLLLRSIQSHSPPFPLSLALFVLAFNLLNSYVQTRSISCYASSSSSSHDAGNNIINWTRVAVGVGLFAWGMWVNVTSDLHLVRLKSEGKGYRIPKGGWFDYVSSPNYMGELAEWLGWAVLTGTPAAWGFFLSSCSILVPRARANLRWYRDKFGDEFPRSRKAIFPFVF